MSEPGGLLPFFEWAEATWLGTTVRASLWLFPVVEAVHLLGLCLLGGALLVVDMRMVGIGLTRTPVAELSRSARPWLLAGIALMVVTGLTLFLSEAIKLYYSRSFWVKITTLPVALAFTLGVRERVARNEAAGGSTRGRIVGALSIALWFVVAAAGRWIGFS